MCEFHALKVHFSGCSNMCDIEEWTLQKCVLAASYNTRCGTPDIVDVGTKGVPGYCKRHIYLREYYRPWGQIDDH